jgi:hypothetical protein
MIGKINTFSGFTIQYKICKLSRGTYIIIKCEFNANETRHEPRHNVNCINIKHYLKVKNKYQPTFIGTGLKDTCYEK